MFKVANEVKVGALATVAIVLLVLGYNMMRGKNLLNREKIYYATYDRVDGLALAGHVRFNGMNIGRVQEMELAGDGSHRIRVSMNVAPDLKIPVGSVARIVQIDLFGTKALQIELSEQTQYLRDGDTLVPAFETDILSEVQDRAASLLSSLDTVVTSVKLTFNEETQENLQKSFASIQSTLNTLDKSLANNSGRLDKIFANIESITTNLEQNKEQITAIITNLNAITDSLRRADFANTVIQARDALEQANEVMKKINEGEGSMGLLVNDPKLYNDLDSAAKSLDELLKDLKENPKSYVHFSVFGKKDKPDEETK